MPTSSSEGLESLSSQNKAKAIHNKALLNTQKAKEKIQIVFDYIQSFIKAYKAHGKRKYQKIDYKKLKNLS